MTCNQCLHRELCNVHGYIDADECGCYKDKSRYIELPCAVGDTVWYVSFGKVYKGKCHAITLKPTLQIHLYDFDGDNASYSAKDVFPTKEQAEQALKGGVKE